MESTNKCKIDNDEADIFPLPPEEVRNLVDELTPDQIQYVLRQAACRHADVRDFILSTVEADLSKRRLYIRDLCSDITTECLRSVFSDLGEIEEAAVISDKVSGKCEGFVIFQHVNGAIFDFMEACREARKAMEATPTPALISNNSSTSTSTDF